MKYSIKDFVGTLLTLVEVIGFILLIGFAGGVDQDMISITEGYKRITIDAGVMVICGLILVAIARSDDRE